ncbi:MAG: hypothetical protein LBC03_07340, partial [Nitrososphaerota archaeon]|nr:hypothetical protein [Nitrososphaerota archaeon]
ADDIIKGVTDDELPEKIQAFSEKINVIAEGHKEGLKKIKQQIDDLLEELYPDALKAKKLKEVLESGKTDEEQGEEILMNIHSEWPDMKNSDAVVLAKYNDTRSDTKFLDKVQELKILNDTNEVANEEEELKKVLKNILKSIDLINDIVVDDAKEALKKNKATIINIANDIAKELTKEDFLKTAYDIREIINTICADEILTKIQTIRKQISNMTDNMDKKVFINKVQAINKDVKLITEEELLEKAKAIRRILPMVFNDISDNEAQKNAHCINNFFSISNDISDAELKKIVETFKEVLPNRKDSACTCNTHKSTVTPVVEETELSNIPESPRTCSTADKFLKIAKDIILCEHATDHCLYEKWDAYYMLRRASLLRSMLEKKLDKKINNKDDTYKNKIVVDVTDNVLDAFMYVETYLYGTRSLEAIVQTSEITRGQRFTAKCININGLELYVDKTFKQLLDEKRNPHKIGKLLCRDT